MGEGYNGIKEFFNKTSDSLCQLDFSLTMTKRIRGFVEKLFYTILAYTHGNISPKKDLCQCAHIPWNLIVSIGREYTADPVCI